MLLEKFHQPRESLLGHLLICQSTPEVLKVLVGLASPYGDLSIVQAYENLGNVR